VHRACDKAFGEACGPVTWGQLVALAQQKKLKPQDMVRNGTRDRWKRASSVPGLIPKRRKSAVPAIAVPIEGWYFKAATPRWSPNQIRHTTGTELRRKYGLEGAQVVLGHRKADTTQLYAERDLAKAAEIMREVG
jgi:integrase